MSAGANAETICHVFDGGLSVQEYDGSGGAPASGSSPTVEFIRGEGMGGGIGGMVYSLKHPEPSAQNQEPSIICSHANHRGDVIARSDSTGSLTSFALYEAYGTRPYEWGSDPDRQKANTKEEESDLNLLNEDMRYRDLETGTFLTRDPIGYADGPNVYCYVHCNPIMSFDTLGLWSINWKKVGISAAIAIGIGAACVFTGGIAAPIIAAAFAAAPTTMATLAVGASLAGGAMVGANISEVVTGQAYSINPSFSKDHFETAKSHFFLRFLTLWIL